MTLGIGKWMRYIGFLIVSLLTAHWVFAYPAHYFVVKEVGDGSLSVVSHQLVDIKGMPESTTLLERPNRLESNLSALMLEKASGNAVFETVAIASPWLRGEFHGEDGIDGRVFPLAERLYVVRIPVKIGTVLRLSGNRNLAEAQVGGQSRGAVLELDLDEYPSVSMAAPSPLPVGTATGTIYDKGDPANRLDLLVIAEGYTAAQQSQFVQQAASLVDNFLSIPPYHDFSQLINAKWMFVPSNQSGADKPNCPETPGQPIITVDTAFDATFCAYGIRRLVTVNDSKVLAAAAAIADWDKIMVLVNDTEYGGSGGYLSVSTTHKASSQVIQHEFGHSFSLLADEYDSAYPGFSACSDLTSLHPCEVNVTDQTDRTKLKWAGWVDVSTPVPTINKLADPLATGLWMGARYKATGMYRQCYNGIMRSLGGSFCHVDSEAFVSRLYGGGWGVPAKGIRLIEPNTLPSSIAVSVPVRTDVSFQATLAGSISTDGLTASWIVDNKVARVGTDVHGALQNFLYTVPDTGSHSIELRVTDKTTLVLTAPTSSRSWIIQGLPSIPSAPMIGAVTAGRGSATVSFTKPSSDGGSSITSYTAACTAAGHATRSRSASSSPITVLGLSGKVAYACSVIATNKLGSSVAAIALPVIPLKGVDITSILMLLN